MSKPSWKRHMTAVSIKRKGSKGASWETGGSSHGTGGHSNKFASYLPQVYVGIGNRIDRYRTYETMDQDPEINTGLDILTEFCTQNSEDFDGPFMIHYKDSQMGETEVTTLENRLAAWDKLNDFTTRIFDIYRNTLKMGDQFFVRDPETYEWHWIDPRHVDKIIINEAKGKQPALYFVRDLALNLRDRVVSNQQVAIQQSTYPGSMANGMAGSGGQYGVGGAGGAGGANSPFPSSAEQTTFPIDAENIIHLSMTTGMDMFYPFGTSILEGIFKTYKQKELLEDSIIIYRVQRAPERRVFKIDTGDLPEHMAMAHVERIKNEIHQRRIPTSKGGSTSMMDAAYNPLSILEDFFFPQSADGRGSSVETLPGGDNLGQIDDLRWFNNKLIRGLKIPQSYLPFGPEDTGQVFNDGRVGQALIQEHRFNKYCQRLQATLIRKFDDEFKRYLDECGYTFNFNSFEVRFRPPLNFAAYRKAELESTLIASYQGLHELPFVAKQTILKKMGWTQDDIIENEKLWLQENPAKRARGGASQMTDQPNLSAVGVDDPSDTQAAEADASMGGEEAAPADQTF